MQTEDKARIARLEQLLDEKQARIEQLENDLDGVRQAMSHVTTETFSVLDAVDRQAEAGKNRLERMLGKPFNNKRVIDHLVERRTPS